MKEFRVTIGYRAVVNVDVKANSEDEAKDIALQQFNKEREKWYRGKNQKCSLADDTYGANGVIDMDSTWNAL